MAKRILWVSRHMLGVEQFADLNRIYGDMERKPTGNMITNPVTGKEEAEMAMYFVAWEQVDEVRIVTHRL